jgi:hypothetical protein
LVKLRDLLETINISRFQELILILIKHNNSNPFLELKEISLNLFLEGLLILDKPIQKIIKKTPLIIFFLVPNTLQEILKIDQKIIKSKKKNQN